MTSFNTSDLASLVERARRFHVGIDDQFDRLFHMNTKVGGHQTYPPYNLIKSSDVDYEIELAVAGFSESDIEITSANNELTVTGSIADNGIDTTKAYLHQGIAGRNFTRKFVLADDVVVKGASLVNGILKITMERIIPEEKKARKIAINAISTGVKDQELLIG